jgi:radical SAM superfamily enzyme YgiQ (UPF0313 family)
MRIAVISTYTHPTRLPLKEPSVMQSAVPELIAGLCPADAEIELFNEKECEVPLDRWWDLVFFSYLHAYYEHTKVLSALFRRRGMTTVAGGRHASYFADDVARHFDVVVTGSPEANISKLCEDFQRGQLQPQYSDAGNGAEDIGPMRWDLIDYSHNRIRLPGIEASRGCPFTCNFCVLTGYERYRFRPVDKVVDEIQTKLTWNRNWGGLFDNTFVFLDNNLGGSPKYLRALCEALVPCKRIWGCALTYNILQNEELVRLMAKAGCRYIYTGLESLNPDSIDGMNKGQNKISEVRQVIERCFRNGILLSFGLLVGADGDTHDYLLRLPEYLHELRYFSVTFLGLVCPYPETPYFAQVQREGRLLPGTISRDYDGYTLCHRPTGMAPDEAIEHFKRLCTTIGSFGNVFRHYAATLGSSNLPVYKKVILVSGPEILSIRNPTRNPQRAYVAGADALEEWDRHKMLELGVSPQFLS